MTFFGPTLLLWLLVAGNSASAHDEIGVSLTKNDEVATGGIPPQVSVRLPEIRYSDEAEVLAQELGQEVLDWKVPVVYDDEDEHASNLKRQQQQRSLADEIGNVEPPRQDPPPLNVQGVCSGYNQNPNFDCSCRRSEKLDVFADCTVSTWLCKPDNSSCYEQTFSVILDGRAAHGRDFVPGSRMTTCTKQLDLESDGLTPSSTGDNSSETQQQGRHVLQFETCVEIQPTTPGRFNESVLCGAAMNGRRCNSCSQCTQGNTTITIDCCNVQADAKQTCGFVHGQTGIVLPNFDPVGTHKGCDGGAGMMITTLSSAVLGAIVAGMLWFI